MTTDLTSSPTTIPVSGGDLTLGVWGPHDAPTIVALHGVTNTHAEWEPFARRMSGRFRVVAPDLRGRGGSSDITGPWGMDAHVDDIVSILDAYGIERGILVGHSMGGFVAVLAAVQRPDRIRGIVLVDGGLPAVEANQGGDALTRIVLDAARARLEMVFPTPQAHLEWVRSTLPAGTELSDDDTRILAYDLTATEGGYRIDGSYDAIAADAMHITGDGSARTLEQLERPAILLRAARGLPPREEGLYSIREVAEWTAAVPSLTARNIDDVDHGSIMRVPRALDTIAESAAEMLAVAD